MDYTVKNEVIDNLTLARHDLANFITKHQDTLSASDLDYLQKRVLNRLNKVHQNLNIIE